MVYLNIYLFFDLEILSVCFVDKVVELPELKYQDTERNYKSEFAKRVVRAIAKSDGLTDSQIAAIEWERDFNVSKKNNTDNSMKETQNMYQDNLKQIY